jgi:hypothetical protein
LPPIFDCNFFADVTLFLGFGSLGTFLVAQIGHRKVTGECPLSGVKRRLLRRARRFPFVCRRTNWGIALGAVIVILLI